VQIFGLMEIAQSSNPSLSALGFQGGNFGLETEYCLMRSLSAAELQNGG